MKSLFKSCLSLGVCCLIASNSFAADIVETAVKAGKFNTLAAALGAADLVETLKGPGPFTVFAPTDEAFSKLPAGTVETLLKPENKGKLAGILTYHVVSGKVFAKQVVGLKGAKTVNGQRVDIKVADSIVMVDGAKVVTTDIECDNGVIHIIDSVILPTDKNIPEVATAAGKFTTLLAAVKAAGLVDTLVGKGPFTVFAPTDDAFAKLPVGTVQDLLKPENKQKLVDILTYHVVPGRVYSEDAVAAKTAKTVQGASVSVNVGSDGAKINSSKLVMTDLDASNGVIHVIDAVLMPPAKGADVRRTLEHAVAQGSSLYNAGHHDACAKLYESTMTSLASTPMNPKLSSHMSQVLQAASKQTCPTERSWTLRHGIDQMYTQLSSGH
jgi:transforming growth factor-beta-induced protein